MLMMMMKKCFYFFSSIIFIAHDDDHSFFFLVKKNLSFFSLLFLCIIIINNNNNPLRMMMMMMKIMLELNCELNEWWKWGFFVVVVDQIIVDRLSLNTIWFFSTFSSFFFWMMMRIPMIRLCVTVCAYACVVNGENDGN